MQKSMYGVPKAKMGAAAAAGGEAAQAAAAAAAGPAAVGDSAGASGRQAGSTQQTQLSPLNSQAQLSRLSCAASTQAPHLLEMGR